MNSYWIAELGREQLVDFLIGGGPEVRSSSIEEIGNGLAPATGQVIAIWKTVGSSKRSPLPQVIVGNLDTIEDLLAWSATYLPGLGPLTAQARVLTPVEFQAALELKPHSDWWQLAGAAAGLVIGEVLTNAKRFALPSEVSVAAACSTLSFVLMRATAVGVSTSDFPSLSKAWESLRRQSGQMATAIPPRTVGQVLGTLVEATSRSSNAQPRPNPMETWFQLTNSRSDLLRAIKAVSEFDQLRLLSSLIRKGNDLTAEERIIIFDEVAAQFMDNTQLDSSERSFSIALAAFWCLQSFSQQLSLLQGYIPRLPEIALWLGAMQVAIPISEALAVGEGLGWRLAREMSKVDDLFSYPRADFALSELQFVLRGKTMARTAKLLERSRLDIEIFPGISSFVRSTEVGIPRQQELPIEHVSPRNEDQLANSDPLVAAEQSLESALRLIRSARSKEDKSRYSKRRKRK